MSQYIVINTCFGGFSLSDEAKELYATKADKPIEYSWNLEPDDPILVAVVTELGTDANGMSSDLKVVEVPDGVSWTIKEYDGMEHIAEQHRTWS